MYSSNSNSFGGGSSGGGYGRGFKSRENQQNGSSQNYSNSNSNNFSNSGGGFGSAGFGRTFPNTNQNDTLSKGRGECFAKSYTSWESPGKGRGGFPVSGRPDPVANKNDTPPGFTSSSWSGGANAGFGSGFSASCFQNAPKARTPAPPSTADTPSYGGFMDWREVARETERLEKEKWADVALLIKDIYEEHNEIAALSDIDVENIRKQKQEISVKDLSNKNRQPTKPVTTFEHAFSNYPEILHEISKQSFSEPSPIQCQLWPLIMSGHDVIGIAQTGSGKTLAFLMPIFLHLESQPLPCNQRKGPGCLILSPTRELALQIHSEVKKYRYKGMRSLCVYGGGDRQAQVNSCLEGIDIIIATPGRLNDLVYDKVINLRTITFVVLDEADRMLDMGFEPQIKSVLYAIRPDRQTVMTSATWPTGVRRLAESYLKESFLVVVGSLDLRACSSVTQVIQIVSDDEKRVILFDFLLSLKPNEKIIVFVAKKSLVDDITSDLNRMGVRCQSLHGDRDQRDREQALRELRSGETKILIATDVASRGLDIADITHVCNYDFPKHMEEYVHRVGRTGRAGRAGVSVTFMTRYDWRHATSLIKILEESNQEVSGDLRKMAERYEQKLLENPAMGQQRSYSKPKREYFVEDNY